MRLHAVLLVLLAGCASVDEQRHDSEDARAALAPEPKADLGKAGAEDAGLDARLAATPTVDLVRDAALQRNPDARAALERWVAALESVPQRTALPDPSFEYTYSSFDRAHFFAASQEIPFPTKLLAEGRAALAGARAAEADYRERRNALAAEAEATYAALYLARRELAILDENLAVLGRFVDGARQRYSVGSLTQSEVLRAEVERDTVRAERAPVAGGIVIATSALNALLDRRPAAAIGPLARLPEPPTPTAGDGADLLARALDARPELAAARDRFAAADAMVSRARQAWIPDFTIGGAYVRDFGMHENDMELTGGFTLPVFWGRIDAGIAGAEADRRRAAAELRAAENRVLADVAAALARTVAAADRYHILAEAAVPRARQNVEASEAAFTTGAIDFLALLDAQRMLLARELEAERALAEHAIRRAELARAVGAIER